MIAPVHAGPPPLTFAAQSQEMGRGEQDCNDLEEDGNEDLAEDSLAPKPRRRQGGEEGGQEGCAARIGGASAQGSDLAMVGRGDRSCRSHRGDFGGRGGGGSSRAYARRQSQAQRSRRGSQRRGHEGSTRGGQAAR